MKFPKFIIWSSRNGYNHEGDLRFARDEKNVRNRIKGIRVQYPDAEIKVFLLNLSHEVTADFVPED